MSGRNPSAPRCAAIVGPYLSGKTTLLESLLFACGATQRKGTVKEGKRASPCTRYRPSTPGRLAFCATSLRVSMMEDQRWDPRRSRRYFTSF